MSMPPLAPGVPGSETATGPGSSAAPGPASAVITDPADRSPAGVDAAADLLPLTVRLETEMAVLEPVWRHLQAQPAASLHQAYDWCAAWVATCQPELLLVDVRAGETTVLLLPLEIVRHGPLTVAQFIATRFSNLNTGLADPAFLAGLTPQREAELIAALSRALTGRIDLLLLDKVPLIWRGVRFALATLPAVEHQNAAFQLPLLADFATTLTQINAKRRRKKFRNQVRKLEEMGGYRHVMAATAQDKASLLDRFFAQKTVRFAQLGLPDVFAPAHVRRFFHGLAQAPAAGHERTLELHGLALASGEFAAIAGLSRKGDHVICQFGSIDERIAPEASPGELLFWLMIEKSCRDGATLFDFGLGDQAYKRSWCPVETVQHDLFLALSLRGRAAALALRTLVKSKALIKRHPRLYGLMQAARRLRSLRRPPESSPPP